jgi:hypothetical protein
MDCVNMNNENAPPQSNQWPPYQDHQLVTAVTDQGNNSQMCPVHPSGINALHHFPQGFPLSVSRQHFVPTSHFLLIPQVTPAHKYPNSPWEIIHPPGEIMQHIRDLTRSTRLGVPSHSQPLINAKYQIQVTNYL